MPTIQATSDPIRSTFALFLSVFIFVTFERAVAEDHDWADISQRATVVEASKARSGDVWGLLGKDGGYRWMSPYPCQFIIDLGETREIRSLYFDGTNFGMWSPDRFTVEYLDENSEWKILASEDGWAATAAPGYIKTLPAAVKGRKIRFRAEKGGLHKDISEEHKSYVTKARGNNLLLSHFSLYSGTRVPALVNQLQEELSLSEGKTSALASEREWMSAGMAETYDRLAGKLKAIQEVANDGSPLTDDLLALQETRSELEKLHQQTFRTRNQQLQQRFKSGHLAGIAPPMERIREDQFTGPVNHRSETWSARREDEDLQIAFYSGGNSFGNLRLQSEALAGPNGHSISPADIRIYRGVYVNASQPHYAVDHTGRHFDGLVPLSSSSPAIRAETEKTTIFWATIHTPENQPAGKYQGHLKLYDGETLLWDFEIIHHVWDFSLPVTPGLKNIFGISEAVWKSYYRKGWSGPGATTQGYKEFADLWLRHRLSPTNLYTNNPQPDLETASTQANRGLNTINIGRASGPNRDEEWFKGFLVELKEKTREVKSRGLQDKAFVYLTDEPLPKDYPMLIDRAKRIKQVTDLPLYAAFHIFQDDMPEELVQLIDIWGPTFNVYEKNREWFQERRKKGNKVWWYFVGWGFNIDQSPLRARAFTWMTWNENLEGVMQWAANRYWHRGQTIDNWDARSYLTHNGLANYVYPGPDGTIYPSARLEHMRDGMEDYEYLHLLKTLLEREEKSAEPDANFMKKARAALDLKRLIPTITTINESPSLWTARRNEIGHLIHSKANSGK